MSFNFFSWLREKAKQSVLGGVADALDELDHDAPAADLDGFRKRLAASGAKQLAAAPDDEPKAKKGR